MAKAVVKPIVLKANTWHCSPVVNLTSMMLKSCIVTLTRHISDNTQEQHLRKFTLILELVSWSSKAASYNFIPTTTISQIVKCYCLENLKGKNLENGNKKKEKRKKALPSSESYSRQIRQHAAEEDSTSTSFVISPDPASLDASASPLSSFFARRGSESLAFGSSSSRSIDMPIGGSFCILILDQSQSSNILEKSTQTGWNDDYGGGVLWK